MAESRDMIRVTRLNNQPLVINAEVIAYVEANPDTLITLVNGDRVLVRESVDEVVDLTAGYRRRIFDRGGIERSPEGR